MCQTTFKTGGKKKSQSTKSRKTCKEIYFKIASSQKCSVDDMFLRTLGIAYISLRKWK